MNSSVGPITDTFLERMGCCSPIRNEVLVSLSKSAMIGHNEAKELYLRDWELRALEAFLNTLSAPVAADDKWLRSP